MLPSGASDAVLVIDKAGFISHWNPGNLMQMGLFLKLKVQLQAEDVIPDLLSLLFTTGAFIPLVFFALPRKRIEPPTPQIQALDSLGQLEQEDSDFT